NIAYNPATAQNETILVTQINTLLCPSDGNVPIGTRTMSNGTGASQIAYSNYPNNIGTIYRNNGGVFDGPAYIIGQPATGGTVTLASITDGTSNTVSLSEFVRGKNGTTSLGLHQVYSMPIAFPTANTFVPLITYLNACKTTTTVYPSGD